MPPGDGQGRWVDRPADHSAQDAVPGEGPVRAGRGVCLGEPAQPFGPGQAAEQAMHQESPVRGRRDHQIPGPVAAPGGAADRGPASEQGRHAGALYPQVPGVAGAQQGAQRLGPTAERRVGHRSRWLAGAVASGMAVARAERCWGLATLRCNSTPPVPQVVVARARMVPCGPQGRSEPTCGLGHETAARRLTTSYPGAPLPKAKQQTEA